MTSNSWVMKFGLADKQNQPILIYASPKVGGSALDVDLVATDGESAYRLKLRDRKLEKYRAESYEGTNEEWASILRHVLVAHVSNELPKATRDSLEVDCRCSGKGSTTTLIMTFRTHVEDITHKLGALNFAYSEDTDDIDLFGWAIQAVESRDTLASQARELKLHLDEADNAVASLRAQLQELETAKAEHEIQLLSKFTLLLNEKKLRIRTQQRQLADPHASLHGESSGRSASAKQKTNVTPKKRPAESDDESEGFDAMDIDGPTEDTHSHVSEDAGTSSRNSESKFDPSEFPAGTSKSTSNARAQRTRSETPPPRELPFVKKTSQSASDQRPQPPFRLNTKTLESEDEETASEDDEL